MLKILHIILALSYSLYARESLVFAPLPVENVKTVYTQYAPMIKYLEKNLNKKIVFDYNANYEDILEKFAKKQIDLAILGPLPYVELKKEFYQTLPLVHFKNNNGDAFYTCSLIAFATTNTTLENIKNKKIALTQPLSTCGYFSVNAFLEKANNSLENNKYRFIGRHDSVALSVARGEFDFGGVKSDIAQKYSNLGIKELAKSEKFPSFTLVGNQETLAKEILKKIQDLLKNVKKEEFQKWGEGINNGCSDAKEADFNIIKKIENKFKIPNKGNF